MNIFSVMFCKLYNTVHCSTSKDLSSVLYLDKHYGGCYIWSSTSLPFRSTCDQQFLFVVGFWLYFILLFIIMCFVYYLSFNVFRFCNDTVSSFLNYEFEFSFLSFASISYSFCHETVTSFKNYEFEYHFSLFRLYFV